MFENKDKNQGATVGDLEEFAVMIVNNFATKDDLRQELKNYATKDDLRQELKNYATKDDLRQELKNYATKDDVRSIVKDEMERVIDDKVGKAVERVIDDKVGKIVQDKVEKVMGEYVNIILDSNDKMVKKLDTFLTEKTVLGGQIKEQGEEADKLKNRVRVIEKHVGLEPAAVGV